MQRQTFPSPEALRRLPFGLADVVVFAGALALLAVVARVGFARAFVVQPTVLLLDEPFSALDVLTAENLRGEIGDLWEAGNFPARSILIVTHSIDEARPAARRWCPRRQ